MVWVTVLRWRDDALTPNPPNFVFPSRCVTGCTRWHQTPQCYWRTLGSICSLTPWLTPQGPSLESSCPLNCPLLTERHLMTSWHNKLTSGFRSGFAVWCLSFSSKISKLQTSSSVVYAVSSLNTSRCKTVMVWIIKAFFSSLVTTFRYVCDLSGCGVQKYLGLFFFFFLLNNLWINEFPCRVQKGLDQMSLTWVRKSLLVPQKSKQNCQWQQGERRRFLFQDGVRRWHKASCQVSLQKPESQQRRRPCVFTHMRAPEMATRWQRLSLPFAKYR